MVCGISNALFQGDMLVATAALNPQVRCDRTATQMRGQAKSSKIGNTSWTRAYFTDQVKQKNCMGEGKVTPIVIGPKSFVTVFITM